MPFLLTLLLAATISTPAQKLLDQSDAFEAKGDQIAAMSAYLRAVKLDPAAEDLSRVRRFRFIPAEVPDGQRAALAKLVEEALRLYVARHPLEWEAVDDFAVAAEPAEALKALETYRAAHPEDPRVYQRRGNVRLLDGKYDDAFADYSKAIELDPENAFNHYHYGVASYEVVRKGKADRIAAGLAALDRAIALKPDYREAHAYRALLLKEQASRETDPEKKKAITAAAEAAMEKVRALLRK